MSRSNGIDFDGGALGAYFFYNRKMNEVENSNGRRFIYKITSPSNAVYIGQSANATKRIARYKLVDCKSQKRLYYSISKHGWENHSVEMIDMASDQESLCKKEIFWIAYYKSKNYEMLNLNNGGRVSDKTKLSDASRKAISDRLKGKPGIPRTEITKEKLRTYNTGKTLSEEHRLKISKSHIGRKSNPDVMKKLRDGHKKHVRTIAESLNCIISISRPVYCFNNDTTYESISEAARCLNLNSGTIHSGLRRGQELIKGYRFKYSDAPKRPFYKTKNKKKLSIKNHKNKNHEQK